MQKFLSFLTWFNFFIKVTLKKYFSFAKSLKMPIFALSNHKRKENMFLKLCIGGHVIDTIEMVNKDTCCLCFQKETDDYISVRTIVEYWANTNKWDFVDQVYTTGLVFLYECPTTRMTESEKTAAMKYMAWWMLHFANVKFTKRLIELMEQKQTT